ncbi:MAG: hypothetical protein NBKEAIPA_01662 [Nitrospirae bacterium]|nr:hypothetical protein [Nitrospirota bacterium]
MVVEHDQALEQGLAALDIAPALDLDQRRLFELPQFAVLLQQTSQPFGEDSLGSHPNAQRQGVDEEADHALDPGNVGGPTGHGRAEQHL